MITFLKHSVFQGTNYLYWFFVINAFRWQCILQVVCKTAYVLCSDGSFWHPLVSKSDTLYAFNTDLCRSLYFTCDGTESVVSGVSTYHFVPPPRVFNSPEKNPDNRGFCTPATDCLLDGVLNVTECRGTVLVYTLRRRFMPDIGENVAWSLGMKFPQRGSEAENSVGGLGKSPPESVCCKFLCIYTML